MLVAADAPEQMQVIYDLGGGSSAVRISPTFFAVGWNGRYLVAKQHPKGNSGVTNFYYLDILKDSPGSDPSACIVGQMPESEFALAQQKLGLPQFSRTIQDLE